jgi:hypothetical protein
MTIAQRTAARSPVTRAAHPSAAAVSGAGLRRAVQLAALALPVLLLIALRAPSLFEPHWAGDEGIFAAIASDIRHGDVLYADTWDNKPPLIFLTYAATQAAFGAGMLPLHLVATLAALLALLALLACAARLYGTLRACAAGLLFATVVGTPIIEANVAGTEVFMVAPIALAMLAALAAQGRDERARMRLYAVAGLLLGVAASYKQVAAFDAAALLLVVACAERRRTAALASIAGGAAVPWAFALTVFAALGAADDYVYAVAGSLDAYGAQASLGAGERALRLLPAAAATVVLLAQRGRVDVRRDLPAAWLAFAASGAFSSPFVFPHYLIQVAAPFALVCAGLRLPVDLRPRGLAHLALLAVVAAMSVSIFGGVIRARTQTDPFWYYRGMYRWSDGEMTDGELNVRFDGTTVSIEAILAAIEADGGGDSLFAWGDMPWLYARGGMSNPTPYSSAWFAEWLPGARARIIDDLERAPPDYIVLVEDAPLFAELQVLLDRHGYRLRHTQWDWSMYARAASR